MASSPAGAVGIVVPGYTVLNAPTIPNETFQINGTWPNFSVNIGAVDKNTSVFVRFVLKFNPKDKPYAITGTLSGTAGGEPIKPCDERYGNPAPASSTDTRALYCNEDECTDLLVVGTITVVSFTTTQNETNTVYTVIAAATNGEPVAYSWQYSDDSINWFTLTDSFGEVTGADTNALTLFTTYDSAHPTRVYRVTLSAANAIGRIYTLSS